MGSHQDDVADSRSAERWRVEEHGWKELVPALPDEVIALLAPPVVVVAEACAPQVTPAPPAAAPAPAPPAAPTPADVASQLLAPAPPRRARRHSRRAAGGG